MLRVFAALIFGVITAGRCFALDINSATDEHEKLVYLNLWGKIEQGDDQKFRSLVIPLLKRGYLVFKINVFSGGGNVAAAIGLGEQIRTLQTRTVSPYKHARIVNNQRVIDRTPTCTFSVQESYGVGDRRVQGHPWCTCASACFLVWASGLIREGGADVIGVHRITYTEAAGKAFGQMSAPQAREVYEQGQKMFQAYLDKLEVPKSIMDRLWATDSQSMHFLSWPEVQLMSSTPFVEEQTLARCGPDRSTHMSAANNWTATQDIEHVNCYRGLLKELMREGAQKYLATYGG
jgi:hypothetical protein